MSVPEIVHRLVDRFHSNLDAYKSGKFDEAQVRVDFINPLFGKALGWDIYNEKGYSEVYREVVYEDRVKISGRTKAPDYGFYIGNALKFFLEAKKPSVHIASDVDPAVQLRRYAWTAKLPLSVVTDFEEFAVYDGRFAPRKDDGPATARLELFTYDQYVDAEVWDKISSVFSRLAVRDGSLNKYAQAIKQKRGTLTVDDAFLKEIESWRDTLARNLALRNDLNQRQLNYAVQMTIDRIIFLRMAEDRGVEDYKRLLATLDGPNVYGRMRNLFRDADDRYNSGLFHFRRERNRADEPDDLTLGLEIDDKVLKRIIRGLYYPDCPYEFSVLPVEVLGHVYEQFLGKVIRLTESGHRAVVEEKPEVRKAGGVYYTPTYIVDYIVERTVGKILKGKRPGPRGGASRIKIVDPACGSGSFLIGAYQYLLDWHRDRYVEDGPKKWSKVLYEGLGGQWHLTIDEKKRILLNNIYGVDIDSQAVEVTKLSLLLKVLEGESESSLATQLRMIQERALPDLDENIKCGNSLIGSDFYDSDQMLLLDEEEQYRVNVFDWNGEFSQVFEGDNSGFDAVIGNPPYIQLSMQQYYSAPVARYLETNYSSSMGRLNTFGLFFERGLMRLTKQGGMLSYVVPNTILTQEYYVKLRQLLLTRRLNNIASYAYHVFRGAVVEPVVLVVSNEYATENSVEVEIFDAANVAPRASSLQQTVFLDTHKHAFSINVDAETLRLKAKVDGTWSRFAELLNINQAIALKGDRSRSLHNERKDDNYHPVLDGREIGRYVTKWSGGYLEYDLSRIHSCKRTDIFECDEKILFRRVGEGLMATLDRQRFYALNTLVVMTPLNLGEHRLSYILGLFNSRLLDFYYHTFLKSTKRTFSEIQARQVGQLPLRTINISNTQDVARHDKMVELVERMLTLQERLADTKIEQERTVVQRQLNATDRQIDRLVYDLYGLTDEEIKIVEEATS
jgi:type I restriction-modification system DNA methylase subunit